MIKKASKVVCKKLAVNVWGFKSPGLSSNVYLIDLHEPILIDLGVSENAKQLLKMLDSVGYKPKDIKKVIYTHFHYDHIGKPSDFPNAQFFASREEIHNLKKKGYFAVLRMKELKALRKIKLHPVEKLDIPYLKIIHVPGHTSGSIALWLPKKKIMFSGDTLFKKGIVGITNTPTSVPEKMEFSLRKLEKYKYEILCPGHWNV
jgi:glyoxylase-like metal-dependent hydrolase (beta-lactamase superfamily II)